VADVRGAGAEHAAYLRSLGLQAGNEVTAVARSPFGGPVTLVIEGRRATVGSEVTHHVVVERIERREPAMPERRA
jgi:ferrous iron transport protein A